MFSEILKIKPVLDPATTRRMEKTLNQRFRRVATRFGRGLNNVIKGTVAGISLGLLAKILNPLQEIEDKIKRLLGEGTDLSERAARFGTSAGQLKVTEQAFTAEGVSPEAFGSALESFTKSVEQARWELKTTGRTQSEQTGAVENFAREDHSNYVSMFQAFIDSLHNVERAGNYDLITTDRERRRELLRRQRGETLDPRERSKLISEGQIVELSGEDARKMFERIILGSEQHGAFGNVIRKGIDKAILDAGVAGGIGNDITSATTKLDNHSRLSRLLEIQRTNSDYVDASSKITDKMIVMMDKMEKNTLDRQNKQLEVFESLAQGALAAQKVMHLIQEGLSQITILLGRIANAVEPALKYLENLPMFRSMRGR